MTREASQKTGLRATSVPLFSLLVPLGFALVMWWVSSSPAMMLFALMGPVAMVASLADARRQGRAAQRAATEDATRAQREAEQQRTHDVEQEAARARRQHPSLADLLDHGHHRPVAREIGAGTSAPLVFRLGLDPGRRPVLIPLDAHVCVLGPAEARQRVARAVTLTRSWIGRGTEAGSISEAAHRSEIPANTSLLLTLGERGWAELTDVRTPLDTVEVLVDEVSEAHAARAQREVQASRALRHATPTLDDLCRTHAAGSTGDTDRDVSGIVGWRDDVSGPVSVALSLEHDGPHFLIAGATGSGKTETLVALIASMAATHAPEHFRFAVIDFKGGGGFVRVGGLPHVAGITTDLDGDDVLRALAGIRVEMERREELLRESGCTDSARLPAERALPRLLVVVDEYRALCEQIPDARHIMADVAARGRALGVHLALASQRAAGAFSDDLVVNAQTRLCLTPVGDDDARYLLGVPAPGAVPGGRAAERQMWLRRRSGEVQAALPICADVRTLECAAAFSLQTEAHGSRTGNNRDGKPGTWRLWWPELPRDLTTQTITEGLDVSPLAPDVVRLGLRQDSRTTRWSALDYSPHRDGSLAVVGGPRLGKSTLLTHVATGASYSAEIVPSHHALAWDTLTTRARQLKRAEGASAVLLVVDGLDAIVRETPDEFSHDLISALENICRDGPRHGMFIAFSASTDDSLLGPMARHVSTRITLGSRIPGRGVLDGDAIQVLRLAEGILSPFDNPGHHVYPAFPALNDVLAGRRAVVITEAPEAWSHFSRSGGDAPTVDVLTPDRALSLSEEMRHRLRVEPVVWHRVSRTAARYVGRDPHLIPPPLNNSVVVLDADNTVTRAGMPQPHE